MHGPRIVSAHQIKQNNDKNQKLLENFIYSTHTSLHFSIATKYHVFCIVLILSTLENNGKRHKFFAMIKVQARVGRVNEI